MPGHTYPPSLPPHPQPAPPSSLGLRPEGQDAGVTAEDPGRLVGRLPLPRAAEEKALPSQGHPALTPKDRGPLSVGGCGDKETTHLGPGTGVAQEVGAGDQAVPEAATPTAPHTAVAASDCDTGGGRARGDGSAHLGSRAAGRRLIGRLPASPAQHRARAQVVLSGVPRAAAVGSLRRETRLRGSGGTASLGLTAQA